MSEIVNQINTSTAEVAVCEVSDTSVASAPAMLRGSCHCGNASFCVPAGLMRFGFASCHCSACRIIHAAPFVQWSGMNAENTGGFVVTLADESIPLSVYQSSDICKRFFCSRCGTHVYIKYIGKGEERWGGEVHFPTALLNTEGVKLLEEQMVSTSKPRYLHVFYSDRSSCLGNLDKWAKAPKYGGETGLESLSPSDYPAEEE